MAFQTGTATDYLDLLAQLETFAAANGWTVQSSTYDEGTDTDGELILDGEGLGATDNIIVGIETTSSVPDDLYNWKLRGFTSYDGSAFANLPNSSPELYLPLTNTTLDYWFIVNAQRIMIMVKSGTVYLHMYLGFINTFASATEYPYPLFVGGMTDISTDTVADAATLTAYWAENSQNHGYIREPDGTWEPMRNDDQGADAKVWPWYLEFSAQFDDWRDGLGVHILLPAIVFDQGTNKGVFGEFDGLFWVSGFGASVEDTVDVGGQSYIVGQDSTSVGDNDHVALELA